MSAGGGRFGAAAADRRVATLAAVAAVCAAGVLIATLLPWFGISNPVRIGGSADVEVTLWGDEHRDLLLALLLAGGIVLCALTVAVRLTARATASAWWITAVGALAFAVALLIVITRVTDPPGDAGLRIGAVLAVVLGVVATVAGALAARLGRPQRA